MTSCTRCGDTPQPGCQSCENERLRAENAALEAKVRALVAWAGLVVQYMEKGEPYWYGDTGLKEQGHVVLALFRKEATDADA